MNQCVPGFSELNFMTSLAKQAQQGGSSVVFGSLSGTVGIVETPGP